MMFCVRSRQFKGCLCHNKCRHSILQNPQDGEKKAPDRSKQFGGLLSTSEEVSKADQPQPLKSPKMKPIIHDFQDYQENATTISKCQLFSPIEPCECSMMFSVLDSQEDITCNSATLRACSLRWSFSIYQLQPTSTHFNSLLPTSIYFNPLQPTSFKILYSLF